MNQPNNSRKDMPNAQPNYLGALSRDDSLDSDDFPSKPVPQDEVAGLDADYEAAERAAMQSEGEIPVETPAAQVPEPTDYAASRYTKNAQVKDTAAAIKANLPLTGGLSPTSGNAHIVREDGSKHKVNAVRNYSPAIVDICENLYFRYSMISDYSLCPQLMLYKWIIQMEEDDTFFAAVMGTAGHAVIEYMHTHKDFQLTYVDMLKKFTEEFDKALQDSRVPPRIGTQFKTLQAQRDAAAPEYVGMLMGYQDDKANQRFYATCIEQTFALEVYDEFGRRFVFTGTIDQAGFHPDGSFALRDVKFRAAAFKPKKVELLLNMQLSLYTYALKYGKPSCRNCAPTYTVAGELLYNGPCEACTKKIGTEKWPQLIAGNVELLWMRDYCKRQKNEFAEYIESEDEKEINPATGRSRKKRILNPKYISGYKKGDNCGEAHLKTTRDYAFLEVHMADILRLAGMVRDGRFYRKPGDHCEFWCKFSKACTGAFEMEVHDIDLSRMNEHMATVDPFGGD